MLAHESLDIIVLKFHHCIHKLAHYKQKPHILFITSLTTEIMYFVPMKILNNHKLSKVYQQCITALLNINL
jgi:hypothetical protein